MSKQNRWGTALNSTSETQKLVSRDQESETRAQRYRNQKAFLAIDAVRDRASSTRELNEAHVIDLMDSISKLGLVQSIAVDENGVLLAGGHRLAAVRKLRAESPAVYAKWFRDDQVPVIMHELGDDSEADHRALAIELSENEKRRDYTAEEIKHIVGRLRAAGYKEGGGRLKENEKHIVPQLALVLGRSVRTARRFLEADTPETVETKSGVELAVRRCRSAVRQYFAAMKDMDAPSHNTKKRELHDLLERARTLLDEISSKEFGQMAELCSASNEFDSRQKDAPNHQISA